MSDDPIFYVTIFPAQADGGGEIDVSESIMSLTYEDDETKADKLTLQVDNFNLTNFDAPIWKTGNKVEVSWGYQGRTSPPRTCTIQKVTGAVVLSVEALGQDILMNKHSVVKTRDNKKRSDVAREIAEANGYTGDALFIDDTKEVMKHITQARMTDAQLLRDMARREGFEFYVDFDGFHFHKRKLGQQPLRTFTYYTDKTGDIISFNVENDIYARKAGGMTAAGIDPKSKEKIEEKGDNVTNKGDTALAPTKVIITGISERDGSVTGDLVKESGSSHTTQTTEPTKEAAARQIQGSYAKNQLNAVQLTMECRGDPYMLAKAIARIEGIGKTISGNYHVTHVAHKVGSGYVMTVKAKRDGKSSPTNTTATGQASGKGAASDAGVAAKGAQNNATPPANQDDGKLVTKIDPKDGSVSYVDGRGRTQAASPTPTVDPSAPADPLGIVHQQEDSTPDGTDFGPRVSNL